MTGRPVLDASALLCLIFDEPGADRIIELLDDAVIGAVNFSEAIATIIERRADAERLMTMLAELKLTIIPFDAAQAEAAGRLRPATRSAGLSLGDRTCLALALATGGRAVTTDRAWQRVDVDIKIDFAR